MPSIWKRGFNPEIILHKLKQCLVINGDSISYSGTDVPEYIVTFSSMIDLDPSISYEIRAKLIKDGIFQAAKKNKDLTKATVEEAIKHCIRKYNSQPDEVYYLLTTININSRQKSILRFKVNDCYLFFHTNLPRKFIKGRKDVISNVSGWLIDKDEPDSYFVVIRTTAKSEFDAGEKTLNALNLLRGIWNLKINPWNTFGFSRNTPINKLTLGALHTLHKDNGSVVENLFWYEQEYFKNPKKIDFSKNNYEILKFTESIRSKLKKINYKKEIENAIVRYALTLDSLNFNAVLVELWSILELLTCTSHKENFENTIERALFLFNDDRSYHKQVLDHLRRSRNNYVHVGKSDFDSKTVIYQLKNYIENILLFHISNSYKFDSLKVCGSFLDLKPNSNELEKDIALYQKAVKYLRVNS